MTEADFLQHIHQAARPGKRLVFVSGNFNILHAGHLRLLHFAADCGDALIVGVNRDGTAGVHMPASLRLEAVSAIGCVAHAVLLDGEPESFVEKLRPAVVVKGKEHEGGINPEADAVARHGGKLIFSSGELSLSSFELIRQEFSQTVGSAVVKPADYPRRHGFGARELTDTLTAMARLRVLVIGDLIVDEYIACEPLGMSQEDPTIVVAPILRERFVGGAGIVAGHAAGLGATATLCTIAGPDEVADFAQAKLETFGVAASLVRDDTRPTTLKQRFRAAGKTLLRVNTFKHHTLDAALIARLLDDITDRLDQTDLVVFSDFSYGCLPQRIVEHVTVQAAGRRIPMVADSQSSSQVGDIGRFRGMMLVKPTEREARLSLRDFESGLVVVAQTLAERSSAANVVMTMGGEGLIVHTRDVPPGGLVTDRLPAFNKTPVDVAGAGDSLLVSTAMALAAGADIWQATYLGSIAAARQVGRVGNTPLTAAEVMREIQA